MSAIVSRLVHDTDAGEIRDGDRRYLLMRPDVLMGMLHGLDDLTRVRVLESLAASVERHGGRSVRAYSETAAGNALLDVMCDTSAGLGWGRWHIEDDAGTLRLTVHNSPFSWGHGSCAHPVCAPVVGIFRAAAAIFFNGPTVVEEVACAAMTSSRDCHFIVRPVSLNFITNPR